MAESQENNNYKGIVPIIKILGSKKIFCKVQTLDF